MWSHLQLCDWSLYFKQLEVSNRKLSAASLHCSWYAVTSHSLTLSAPASINIDLLFTVSWNHLEELDNTSFVEFWAEKVNMAHSGVLNYINVVQGQRHFNYNQVTPQ